MSLRRTVIAVAVVAVLGVAGLLVASETHQRPTAFSVDINAASLAPPLTSGKQACQSTIRGSSPFAGVRVWIWPDFMPTPGLAVSVRDADTKALLATGRMAAVPPRPALETRSIVPLYPTPVSRTAVLTAVIPSSRRVSVCLRSYGPGTATLMGAPPNRLSGTLYVAQRPTRLAMALVFLRPQSRSLLSLLPTVFRRAAMFRPGWVGGWTFWVLAGGLLLCFCLVGVAVVHASRADATAGEHPNRG